MQWIVQNQNHTDHLHMHINMTQNRLPHVMDTCYDRFTFFDIVPCSYNDRVRSASLIFLGDIADDGDAGAVYEMKKNHGPSDFEPFDSVLSLRKDKALNFFKEVQGFFSVQHYIPVTYETLVDAGTSSLIKDIEWKLNLQSRCDPKKLANPSSGGTKIYSKEYIQFINDHVDWSVEEIVGYQPLSLNSSGKYISIVDGQQTFQNASTVALLDDAKALPPPTITPPILDSQITNETKYNHSNYTLDNILESVHLHWHPRNREQRFPSVDERVKVYMSNWYLPCHKSSDLDFKVDYYNESYPLLNLNSEGSSPFRFDSKVKIDFPIILHRPSLEVCVTENSSLPLYKERVLGYSGSCRVYCQDAIDILDIAQGLVGSNSSHIPLIVQFGDNRAYSRTVPIISKYRMRSFNKESLARVLNLGESCQDPYLNVIRRAVYTDYYWDAKPFYQPIIWNLNADRHFGYDLKESRHQDIPWENKKLGALWIGNMNGGLHTDIQITPDVSSVQICQMNARCRFVYQHRNSSLVHAYLTSSMMVKKEDIPELFIERMSKKDILQYKVVISLEGNDVSSGLKWNLLCNSVVMMPPPTATSWLMEELLEPWVHYIPLRHDGSDAEDMIKWVGENDLKAWKIAERGALFMHDLLYHPDAEKDDVLVKKEILSRYLSFWT